MGAPQQLNLIRESPSTYEKHSANRLGMNDLYLLT